MEDCADSQENYRAKKLTGACEGLVEGLEGEILNLRATNGGAGTRSLERHADLIGREDGLTGAHESGIDTTGNRNNVFLASHDDTLAPTVGELGGVNGANLSGGDGNEGKGREGGDLHVWSGCLREEG